MKDQAKILIILDSNKYKGREDVLREKICRLCVPDFYFTDYENKLIKFLHGISGIGNFLSHISYWIMSFVAAWDLFIRRRGQYEFKIFINPIVGVFYCFLLALFNRNDNNISIAGFLFVHKANKLYFTLRKGFVRFSYKKASQIIVYSKNEISVYSKWVPTLASKFKFVKYGRDYDIFEEKIFESDTPYIASGGVSNRDFNTLACAMDILDKRQLNLKCKVATRPNTFLLQCHPANLELLYNIRIDAFGSFLENSMFVVIPLKNMPLSAGHMVLLEAMYRGKIIIITDIPAVRDYVDNDMVFFYKADDCNDLADKIEYVYLNKNDKSVQNKTSLAQKAYFSDYCFTQLLKRIVELHFA